MLQNKEAAPVSAGLKPFVGVALSGEKVTKSETDRAENDAKDFSLVVSALPLLYFQQVNGECRSGAL